MQWIHYEANAPTFELHYKWKRILDNFVKSNSNGNCFPASLSQNPTNVRIAAIIIIWIIIIMRTDLIFEFRLDWVRRWRNIERVEQNTRNYNFRILLQFPFLRRWGETHNPVLTSSLCRNGIGLKGGWMKNSFYIKNKKWRRFCASSSSSCLNKITK